MTTCSTPGCERAPLRNVSSGDWRWPRCADHTLALLTAAFLDIPLTGSPAPFRPAREKAAEHRLPVGRSG